jgi:hypothetical protein
MAEAEPPSAFTAFSPPARDQLAEVFDRLLWLAKDSQNDQIAQSVRQQLGACIFELATLPPAARDQVAWLALSLAAALALLETAGVRRESLRTRAARDAKARKQAPSKRHRVFEAAVAARNGRAKKNVSNEARALFKIMDRLARPIGVDPYTERTIRHKLSHPK